MPPASAVTPHILYSIKEIKDVYSNRILRETKHTQPLKFSVNNIFKIDDKEKLWIIDKPKAKTQSQSQY